MKKIVLIAGFETFNAELYRKAAQLATARCQELGQELEINIFSDRSLSTEPEIVANALQNADVFFASLIFDYDHVMWLIQRVKNIPIRLVFESALELMSLTQLGKFVIGEKPKGMPKPVKFILSKFSSGKEEDKLAGYISFLKTGPKLLKFIPAKKVQDLRNWLIIYGYWNAGGTENVAAMFWTIAEKYLDLKIGEIPPAIETPNMGLLHPEYDGYFTSPKAYLNWYLERLIPPLSPQTPLYPPPTPPSEGGETAPTLFFQRGIRGDTFQKENNLKKPVVGIILYRKHVITKQPYIPQLIRHFEEEGLIPVPIFLNGVEGHVAVRDWMTTAYETQQRQQGNKEIASLSTEAVEVDAIVSTIGFPLVGGPAGSMEAGRQVEVAKRILTAKNIPYLVAAPLLIQDIHSWTRQGIGGLQSVVLYALPELDGAIDTIPLGGLVGEDIYLIPERVKRLTGRLKNWIKLRQTPPEERKIAVILYNFPPGYGATGTAALLNVGRSLFNFLHALKQQGYTVANIPEDGEELIRQIKAADEAYPPTSKESQIPPQPSLSKGGSEKPPQPPLKINSAALTSPLTKGGWGGFSTKPPLLRGDQGGMGGLGGDKTLVNVKTLEKWLGYLQTSRIEKQWKSLTSTGIKTYGDNYHIGGIQLGNIWLGVQPALGIAGDPMRLMFEKDLTPHPQYAAFYKWLQNEFKADAVVHFGMHGTVEWLPGSPLGNTGYSWPDILLGNLPNIYIYAANNPSESILAKRRGYGVLISHNVPPYGRAGLYKELITLRELITEYREDPEKNYALKDAIIQKITDTGLDADCRFTPGEDNGIAFNLENARLFSKNAINNYFLQVYEYLQIVEQRLFSSGLHTLGEIPNQKSLQSYLEAYFGDELATDIIQDIIAGKLNKYFHLQRSLSEVEVTAVSGNAAQVSTNRKVEITAPENSEKVQEASDICDLLLQTNSEMINLLRALNGEYIPPAPGGDLLRDGPGVLPTGRNIHALDPYRMPSPAAYERGREIGKKIIAQHLEENGTYPETVAVMLWGLDAIKTKGESLGIVLELVGAIPVKEGTGRIVRYELLPLSEVGHPRIDILGNLSGIFRDTFVNIIELLDDLFLRAAEANEPESENFIRKHALTLKAQGIENTSARLFSNPAGDFGSLVNDQVVDGNWDSGDELANTWKNRNVFSYGKKDKGQARPEVLNELLKTSSRVVQEIDSVEYGLTDIQEYYANTGGLKKAAEKQSGKKVTASFVESFSNDTNPRKLEDLLRLEYRTKLLNPKWALEMVNQGSGGAYEISQRMTALIGWGGTVDFTDAWVYDQAVETYALDAEMAAKLKQANPEAFRNIIGRMLEASGRGFWQPDSEKLEQLRSLYDAVDDDLENIDNSH